MFDDSSDHGAEPTWDAFVSYSHSDAAAVRSLVQILDEVGVRVFVDERVIDTAESITGTIVDHLSRSKSLLVYYSEHYPTRRACQWELTAAFIAASRGGDPRQRLVVVNPEPGVGHIEPVELRDAKFIPSDQLAERESALGIARDVLARLEALDGSLGDIAGFDQPRWVGMRGVGSERFVGRTAELWAIHSALHSSDVPIITDSVRPSFVQIRGLGGQGKSLLAEEYALRFSALYPGGVFWLRAPGVTENEYSLEDIEAAQGLEFHRVAVEAGAVPVDAPIEAVNAALADWLAHQRRNGAGKCLWVIDDLPPGLDGPTLRAWFSPDPETPTLFTTRSHSYDSIASAIDLGELEASAGYELLTRQRRPIGAEEGAAARGIVGDLGGHALALEVAGAALAAQDGLQTFADYRAGLTELAEDTLDLDAEFADTLPNGHEAHIAATLAQSVDSLGDEGRDFLRIAAVTASAGLPARMIAEIFSEVDGLDPSMARRRAATALRQAEGCSLARKREGTPIHDVHPLVARTVRLHDPDPERVAVLRDTAIAVLTEELEAAYNLDDWAEPDLAVLVPHARELACGSVDFEPDLASLVACYESFWGQYSSATDLQARVLTHHEANGGPDQFETIAAKVRLASIAFDRDDLERARELQEETLATSLRIFGPTDATTMTCKANLGVTLCNSDHLAWDHLGAARALQEEVLEHYTATKGENHPDTLTALNNLSVTISQQGDLLAAEPVQRRLVKALEETLTANHSHSIGAKRNLAQTLDARGEREGDRHLREAARDLLADVFTTRRSLLNDDHPEVVRARSELAATLWALGEYDDCRAMEEAIVSTRKRTLGDRHPMTLESMASLVSTCRAQEDWESAERLGEEIVEGLSETFGTDADIVLSAVADLAVTRWNSGDREGCRVLEQDVVDARRRIVGDDHPDTLAALSNLASSCSVLEDWPAARALWTEVLTTRRRTLGPAHPETLATGDALLDDLITQAELLDALALADEFLAERRQLLGDDHPATISSLVSLASILWDLGDLERARAIASELLATRTRLNGREHPDTLHTLHSAAAMAQDAGDLATAQELCDELLESARSVLGPDDPLTMDAEELALSLRT